MCLASAERLDRADEPQGSRGGTMAKPLRPRNDGQPGSPAIWLYPPQALDVEVSLEFHGGGFMTSSLPSYNGQWRIHIDPAQPFYRYSPIYGDATAATAFLDYDGFRAGQFQLESGWCVAQR